MTCCGKGPYAEGRERDPRAEFLSRVVIHRIAPGQYAVHRRDTGELLGDILRQKGGPDAGLWYGVIWWRMKWRGQSAAAFTRRWEVAGFLLRAYESNRSSIARPVEV